VVENLVGCFGPGAGAVCDMATVTGGVGVTAALSECPGWAVTVAGGMTEAPAVVRGVTSWPPHHEKLADSHPVEVNHPLAGGEGKPTTRSPPAKRVWQPPPWGCCPPACASVGLKECSVSATRCISYRGIARCVWSAPVGRNGVRDPPSAYPQRLLQRPAAGAPAYAGIPSLGP
jgi:hypothetical protein